jgi:hypothetical protein
MGGVDEVAGFNGKVDRDERIGSVGWVLSKGITPTRSGNAGKGQEAVWIFLAHVCPHPTVRNDRDGVTGPSRRVMYGNKTSTFCDIVRRENEDRLRDKTGNRSCQSQLPYAEGIFVRMELAVRARL